MHTVKLFIQIPCFNEEETLPLTVAGLPGRVEGFDEVYTLVIDDGSTDRTAEVAREIGIDYILRNGRRRGLAASFGRGIEACLHLGADVIVNTDGDNQYDGSAIPTLVRPILAGTADIVVGCRDIDGHAEFSLVKKVLQRVGSSVVRRFSGTHVSDTTSGFRALSRSAALRSSLLTDFSFTLEMLIQAGRSGMHVATVPVDVHKRTRESRLARSTFHFVARQMLTVLRVYLFYCPMQAFAWLAAFSLLVSVTAAARIAYFLWFSGAAAPHFKSGTGVVFLVASILTVLFLVTGLIGTVLSGLRTLVDDLRARVRNLSGHEGAFPRETLDVDTQLLRAPEFFRWARVMPSDCLAGAGRRG